MRERWSGRMRWIVALLCLGVAAWTVAAPFGTTYLESALPDADPLGMVLIDIQSSETAAMYHVPIYGVYVLAVSEPSVAYRAGVRSGDHIVSANGLEVSNTAALSELLIPDAPLVLTLRRGERMISLTIAAD